MIFSVRTKHLKVIRKFRSLTKRFKRQSISDEETIDRIFEKTGKWLELFEEDHTREIARRQNPLFKVEK